MKAKGFSLAIVLLLVSAAKAQYTDDNIKKAQWLNRFNQSTDEYISAIDAANAQCDRAEKLFWDHTYDVVSGNGKAREFIIAGRQAITAIDKAIEKGRNPIIVYDAASRRQQQENESHFQIERNFYIRFVKLASQPQRTSTTARAAKERPPRNGLNPATPISPALPVMAASGGSYSGDSTGHWIQSVSSDGAIVVLEDGSTWKVSELDRIDSALWLPIDDIVVVDSPTDGYVLVNTDDKEKVEASYIGNK